MTNGLSKNIRKIKTQFDLNHCRVKPNQAGGIKIDMTPMHATIAFIENADALVLTIIPKETGRTFSGDELKTIFSEVQKKSNKVFKIAKGKIVCKTKKERTYYQIPIALNEYFYESELLERSVRGETESEYDEDRDAKASDIDVETSEPSESSDLSASSMEETDEMELDTSMLLEEDFSEKSGVKGLSETRLLEEVKGFDVSPDSELYKLILRIYKEAIQGLNLGEIVDDMMDDYANSTDPIQRKRLKESVLLLHQKIVPFNQETDPMRKPVSLSFLTQTLFLLRENL